AGDDDRLPGHLDAVDEPVAALGPREERRRAVDRGALRDGDLVAPADQAVPGEVTRERSGRGAGRSVLAAGPEPPQPPTRARTGKPAHARPTERGDRGTIGLQSHQLADAGQADEHEAGAVLLLLDRQLGARDAEDPEDGIRVDDGRYRRHRLLHAAED